MWTAIAVSPPMFPFRLRESRILNVVLAVLRESVRSRQPTTHFTNRQAGHVLFLAWRRVAR